MEALFEEKQIELLKERKKEYIEYVRAADVHGKDFMIILRFILIPLYVYAAATSLFDIDFGRDISWVLDNIIIAATAFEIFLFITTTFFSVLAIFKDPPRGEDEKRRMKKILEEYNINIDFY